MGFWATLKLEEKIDAFNFPAVKSKVDGLVGEGIDYLAIDVSSVRFMSLPCIKFLAGVGVLLAERGGRLALVGLSEKLKRHMEIYATLDSIMVFRSQDEWRKEQPTSSEFTSIGA